VRRARHALGAALLAAAVSVTAGCDGSDDGARDQAKRTRMDANTPASGEGAPPVDPARCPVGLAGCRRASGIVIYVERVDPDGDGDVHFLLASDQDVTAEGISVVDVRRDLRPDPLPGPGDRISAAGPVHRGSFGQRQIEAVVVHAAYTAPE
jgi:hypothetical protein